LLLEGVRTSLKPRGKEKSGMLFKVKKEYGERTRGIRTSTRQSGINVGQRKRGKHKGPVPYLKEQGGDRWPHAREKQHMDSKGSGSKRFPRLLSSELSCTTSSFGRGAAKKRMVMRRRGEEEEIRKERGVWLSKQRIL